MAGAIYTHWRWPANAVGGGEIPRIDGDVAGYGLSSFCGEAAVVLATVKDARRRFAVALRPSLTAAARVGARCAGRDDGMAVLIEQQDDFWSGSVAISTDLAGWRGSGRAVIGGSCRLHARDGVRIAGEADPVAEGCR
jgi:hypothetical protein